MASGRALQFERLLFFSDAVFAIAITLLIIEIRLPHIEVVTDQALAQALLDLIPNYVGFIVSFFVVGRFWVGHHAQFGLIDAIDRTLVWRNLLFLGVIAFMPFPTAVIAEYAGSRVAVIFYCLWLVVAGLLSRLVANYVRKLAERQNPELTPEQLQLLRGSWMPMVIGTAGALGALVDARIGLLVLILSPLFMLLFQRLTRPKLAAA